MTRHFAKLVAAVALAILTVGAPIGGPLSAQTEIDQPSGDWTHQATGVSFPDTLGEFKRVKITEFSEDGRDSSVSYTGSDDNGTLTFTIYLYPRIKGWNCVETFNDSAEAVAQYPGAQVIGLWLAPSPDGARGVAAMGARYLIPGGAMRQDLSSALSDLYLYCPTGSEWLVKYRASWFSGSAETFPNAMQMLQEIDWGKLGD